jgi:vancomycin resistance protein YoaR
LPNAENANVRSSRSPNRPRFQLPGLGPLASRIVLGILIGIVTLVVIFGVVVFVDAGLYHNEIHSGISIAGQDMGGRTEDEAIAELTKFVQRSQQPITLTSGTKTWTVTASDVGVGMDIENAVRTAMNVTRENGFLGDLKKKFTLYRSGVDIPLVGTVDATDLDAVLSRVAQDLDVAPVDASIVMANGQITVVESRQGQKVDQATLRQQIKDLVLALKGGTLEVPLTVIEPRVTVADVQPVLEQAETMVGSPLELTSGDQKWTLTSEQLLSYLEFTYEDVNGVSTPVPYLSATKMAPFFESIADAVATPPVDARFECDGEKAWVVPGVPGSVLDATLTAEAVTEASARTTSRTAEVVVMESEPDLTTEEAEAMGIKDLLAKYTTEPYWGSANRRQNVRVATGYCSNIFMAPGDIFNTDERLGPRTPARGYTTAPGIVSLGELEDVLGGGICQVSTTLFNAVFFAGLEVVERHNHSIYIDHYPLGRDATVTAGGKNMRFRNDTDHYLWIVGESDGVTTTFYIYGTDDGRSVEYETTGFYNYTSAGEQVINDPSLPMGKVIVEDNGSQGKTCLCTRIITYADGTTKTEKFYSVFPPVPKKIIKGTGATTTTTTSLPPTTTTTSLPPTTEPPPPTTTEPPTTTTP